jgi:hypothetical protein
MDPIEISDGDDRIVRKRWEFIETVDDFHETTS